MNSFARFGIDHLSASSLNLWRGAPGLWTLRYIAKLKDDGNPAMWRGTAVESGLAALLRGAKLEVANQVANNNFWSNSVDGPCDPQERDAEQSLIWPMLQELTKWKPPGFLNATQLRIEYFFDPVPIPVVGYLDFAFDNSDVDLKTTKACPSVPRPDNVRQVSLYRAARNRAGGLLYVTTKKHAYFDVNDEQMNEAVAEMAADALALNNFLARCDTREDALKSLPIDWSHWSAPKVKVPLSDILLAG